jgi:hypothetical protein
VPPTYEVFLKSLESVNGSAGLDGWQVQELCQLAVQLPAVMEELHQLLIRTTLELTPPAVAAEHMNWRVVGIPKTGATDSRPIAVGAVIVRCWSKALLPWLPEVPEGQWSERGVVAGAADWLATEGVAGGEVDLAKAFDTLSRTKRPRRPLSSEAPRKQ